MVMQQHLTCICKFDLQISLLQTSPSATHSPPFDKRASSRGDAASASSASKLRVRVDRNAGRLPDLLHQVSKASTDRALQLACLMRGEAVGCQLGKGNQALHDGIGKAGVAQICQPHKPLHMRQNTCLQTMSNAECACLFGVIKFGSRC